LKRTHKYTITYLLVRWKHNASINRSKITWETETHGELSQWCRDEPSLLSWTCATHHIIHSSILRSSRY